MKGPPLHVLTYCVEADQDGSNVGLGLYDALVIAVVVSLYVGLGAFKALAVNRHSPLGAKNPFSFWECLKPEATTLALGCAFGFWGWLHERKPSFPEPTWFALHAVAMLGITLVIVFAMLARIRVDPRRMFRWRSFFSVLNFCAGACVGSLSASDPLLHTLLQYFLLRNAGLYGEATFRTVHYYSCNRILPAGARGSDLCFWTMQLLRLAGGTAETGRDTRLVVLLVRFAEDLFQVVERRALSSVTLLFWVMLAHLLNLYARQLRPVERWREAIGFLRLSELRRRRQASAEFRLQRRQEMDPAIFGDPARARHLIIVSHAWLSPSHADPEGLHLDLLLGMLDQRLCPYKNWIRAFWWRLYYYFGEADVLIFFDMSSLDQAPRTKNQEDGFRLALDLMSYLYSHFEVLVIDEIPEDITWADRRVPFIEKGWCWAEINQAMLGDMLRLSPEVQGELSDEKDLRQSVVELKRETLGDVYDCTRRKRIFGRAKLSDSLWGFPRYPAELLAPSKLKDLLQFRDHQYVKGKVFSSGKIDMDRVSKQLMFTEKCRALKARIESGDAQEACRILNTFSELGDTHEANRSLGEPDGTGGGLTNVIFDCEFTTPLHLAVARNFPEITVLLLDHGAMPRRNFVGDLPWEHYGLPRWSLAARVARRWRRVDDDSVHLPTAKRRVSLQLPTWTPHDCTRRQTSAGYGSSLGSSCQSMGGESWTDQRRDTSFVRQASSLLKLPAAPPSLVAGTAPASPMWLQPVGQWEMSLQTAASPSFQDAAASWAWRPGSLKVPATVPECPERQSSLLTPSSLGGIGEDCRMPQGQRASSSMPLVEFKTSSLSNPMGPRQGDLRSDRVAPVLSAPATFESPSSFGGTLL